MAHFIQAHTANEAWLKALDLIRKSPAAVVLDGQVVARLNCSISR
jgi:hypothetical protein